jgi:hypothetical protein
VCFEVFTAVKLEVVVFRVVAPCSVRTEVRLYVVQGAHKNASLRIACS